MEEKYSSIKAADLNEASSPIEKYAKKVLEKLIEDGIPPLPNYYRDYFYNLLEKESLEFRKHIFEMLSLEEANEFEKDFEYEKKIKLSFKYTKELLQRVAIVYKSSTNIKALIEAHLKEVGHITSPKALEKIIKQLESKIEQIYKKLEKEQKAIKNLYAKNVELIKEIESNTLFDAKYGVYNKRYFLKMLEREVTLVDKFKHISSLVTLKIKDEIINGLSEKGKILINRSLAKILLKTSRRSDIIAHLGNGVFAMLLKHTDRIGAGRTVERISDMVGNAAIFLEGEEIELSIVAGIEEIKEKKEVKEIVENSFESMQKAQEENILYTVYEGEN
ncbi:GGDEF domain-containing protein [Caminibacter sp.]